MFDRLFKPKTLSRFESCQELKQLLPILKRLRDKEKELKRDGDNNGVASADFRKHLIIAKLLSELDAKIQAFNHRSLSEHHEEVTEMINLVREMAVIVRDYCESFESTLMAPRNNRQKAMKEMEGVAVGLGTYGAAGYLVLNWPIGLIGSLVTLLYVAPAVNDKALHKMGLKKENFLTATIQLLDELLKALVQIGENLGLARGWDKNMSNQVADGIPDEFICPILGKVMTRPVVCRLDGKSYEEGAIKKWLLEKGTSPFNRAQMNPNQSVEDVLTINRNLLDSIDRMRQEHPKLFDEEYQQVNTRVGARIS